MPDFPSLPIIGGLSRRQVLKNAGTGFGYLALAGLLGENAPRASAASPAKPGPLSPKQPHFPVKADWRHRGQVVHVFTHFRLELEVWSATISDPSLLPDGWWADPRNFDAEALPTVFRKALATAGLE